jgi:hypothetical protein
MSADDFLAPPISSDAEYSLRPESETTIFNSPYSFLAATQINRLISYEYDWYDRIHVLPKSIDFGDVTGTTQATIILWNAFREEAYYNDTDASNSLGGAYDTKVPYYQAPMAMDEHILEVQQRGYPLVLGFLRFNFNLGYVDANVLGSKATILIPQPIDSATESLSWTNEIITSFNGEEQRIRVRPGGPIQTINYSFYARDFSRALMHFIFQTNYNKSWGVPIWWEGTFNKGILPIGSLTIPLVAASGDFRSGAAAIIVSDAHYEIVLVEDFLSETEASISFATTLEHQNYFILPLRVGVAQKVFAREVYANKSSLNEFKFGVTINDNINLVGDCGYPLYRDLRVLNREPLREKSISEVYSNQFDVFETGTGPLTPVKRWAKSKVARNYPFKFKTRDFWPFRLFLHECAGQLVPFFMKSYDNLPIPHTDILDASNEIIIKNINYASKGIKTIYKYLCIVLYDGTELYFKITGATKHVSGVYETLQVEESTPYAIPVADIKFMYFMVVARLATDTVQLEHDASGQTTTSISIMGIDYDV